MSPYPSHPKSPNFGQGSKQPHVVAQLVMSLLVLACMAGAVAAQPASFSPPVSYVAGNNPFTIAVGDLNGDTKPDLALADYSSYAVVMLGNGDGTFQTAVSYPSGGMEARGITIGDFNRDAKPDLAVINYGGGPGGSVAILLGNGDGSFQSAVNYPAGTGGYSITTGDLNGDGKLDLAVANSNGTSGDTISVLIGNGNGTFQSPTNLPVTHAPQSVALADFNHDGKLDIVTAGYGISVLLGKGDGTFQASVDYSAGGISSSVVVGDYNRDGNPDLAVANLNAGTVTILLGNSNGTFQNATGFYQTGNDNTFIATGDFNLDGKLDLVTTGIFLNANLNLLLGNGDGTFQPVVNLVNSTAGTRVTVGDFNRDSRPDLVATINGKVTVLLNTTAITAGTFDNPINKGVETNPYSLVTGDFNLDGKLDLVSAGYNSNDVSVLLGSTGETFHPPVHYPVGNNPLSVTAGDFNGDGKLDVATSNFVSSNISVLLGNGDGSFKPKVDYSIPVTPFAISNGDFNGDGRPDLITVGFGGIFNVAYIHLNNGDGTFREAGRYFLGQAPESVTVGDFSGDGKLDFAAANVASNDITVHLGNGDGTFQDFSQTSYTGANPYSIVAADLNRDGRLDLVTANNGGNSISVLIGNGNGTFPSHIEYDTNGTHPYAVTVGDFNRDGKPDIAAVNVDSAQNPVSVFIGNGDGTLLPAVNYPAGTSPRSIVAGDFNRDGKPDLAVANSEGQSGNSISLLLNSPNAIYSISGQVYGDANGNAVHDSSEVGLQGVKVYIDENSNGKFDADEIYTVTDGNGNYSLTQLSPGTYKVREIPQPGWTRTTPLPPDVVISSANISGIDFGNRLKLTGAATSLDGTEGLLFSGTVASFTYADNTAGPGSFTATINWNDGTGASSGTVTSLGNGNFNVDGKHLYLEEGSYAVTVTVHDIAENFDTVFNSSIKVADAPLTATGKTVQGVEYKSLTGVVATFTDANPYAQASDFTALIFWGETGVSAGVITANGKGGFDVTGTHTYRVLGEATFDTRVQIHDVGGAGTVAFGKANLVPAVLSINNVSVTQSSTTITSATFTVSLSVAIDETLKVSYATADGSAHAGDDYVATSGVLTFAPGETVKTVTVTINPETEQSPNETFSLNLSSPDFAVLSSTAHIGVGTIINPNVAGAVQFSSASYTVNENAGTATVTVTRTGGNASGVTVQYSTSDATAHAGSDYTTMSGTLTFGFGEMSRTITIPIINDALRESDEMLNLTLSNPGGGASLGVPSTGTLTINDDDMPLIRFESSSYSAREDEKFINISVTRSGDTSQPASVSYATSDGTARERTDYTTSSGSLNFAGGETTKSFTVLLTDNAFVDGSRTVNLTLSNPSGAALGSVSSAALTILDNDSAPPTLNPIDDPQFFVRQQYADFLNRAPDDGGLGYWSNEIARCGNDAQCIHDRRVAVADAFFFETEYQQTGGYIYRIYKAASGVKPTYAQFISDRGRVVAGPGLDQSKSDYALYFVQSAAFQGEYAGATTADQFVDRLLTVVKNYSGVDLSAQRASLLGLYDGTNAGKAAILRQVADNPAFIDAEYNRSFVLMEYFGYLRRDPDQGGFDFWLGQVNKFPLRNVDIQHAMACSFITSAEYQTRFSSVVTHSNRECPQ